MARPGRAQPRDGLETGLICAEISLGIAGKGVAAGLPCRKSVAWCFVFEQEQYQSKNVLVVEDNEDDVVLLQIGRASCRERV